MLVKNCSAHGRQQMALAARPGRAQQPEEHVRRRIIGLPFLGELWGEVGGDESWDEALDTVSSGCLRCRSLLSSDRDRIDLLQRLGGAGACGHSCNKSSKVSREEHGHYLELHCLGFDCPLGGSVRIENRKRVALLSKPQEKETETKQCWNPYVHFIISV